MGMADKVRGRDGQQKIVAMEMSDNRDRGDRDTGRWIRRRRRRRTGDRRDVGQWI